MPVRVAVRRAAAQTRHSPKRADAETAHSLAANSRRAMLRRQAAEGFALGGQQTGDGAQQRGLALAALPQQYGKTFDLEAGLQDSHRMVDAVIDAHGLRVQLN